MDKEKNINMIVYYNIKEKGASEKVAQKIYKVDTLICINRQKFENLDWTKFSLFFLIY